MRMTREDLGVSKTRLPFDTQHGWLLKILESFAGPRKP